MKKQAIRKHWTLICLWTVAICHLASGCKDEEKERQRLVAKVEVNSRLTPLNPKTQYQLGDTIGLSFEAKDSFNITKVIFAVDEEALDSTFEAPFHVFWPSAEASLGKRRLRAEVHLDNGKKDIHRLTVTLLSDLVPQAYTYQVIQEIPHDPKAYTQGLLIDDGAVYESTGQRGESTLRRVNLKTGQVEKQIELDERYFGEGIALMGDKIYQLTWEARKGFIYDKESFEMLGEFNYPTEGWGATSVDGELVISDGSNTLYFYQPEPFRLVRKVEVYDHRQAQGRLNELEYINGLIYANVYEKDYIIAIEPKSGRVMKEINLSGLSDRLDKRRFDVLNGIAYDENRDAVFLTGKWWSKMFEVKFIKKEPAS